MILMFVVLIFAPFTLFAISKILDHKLNLQSQRIEKHVARAREHLALARAAVVVKDRQKAELHAAAAQEEADRAEYFLNEGE